MAKHRLRPQPRGWTWLRVMQMVGAVVAFLLVTYGLAGDPSAPRDVAVPMQVDPEPVDTASTPVVYLVVSRGA